MSRIRTVKPEILEDSVTAGLDDMAFRLFIACISLADDYGRLRAEPNWLMGQVYWSRPADRSSFEKSLATLAPLIRFYSINDQRYAEIRNWSKHQKVDRPGKPRIPGPPEESSQPSRDPRESLAQPSRDPREGLATDLGPRTVVPPTPTSDPRESGVVVKSEPRVLGMDGEGGAAWHAWREGIARVTKLPVSELGPLDKPPLVAFSNAHAGGLRGEALVAWITKTAEAFARANDGRYGYTTKRCLAWLDGGRPAANRPPGQQAEVKPVDSRKTFAERDRWAETAGAPDPEAQARLNKLLGKVGR